MYLLVQSSRIFSACWTRRSLLVLYLYVWSLPLYTVWVVFCTCITCCSEFFSWQGDGTSWRHYESIEVFVTLNGIVNRSLWWLLLVTNTKLVDEEQRMESGANLFYCNHLHRWYPAVSQLGVVLGIVCLFVCLCPCTLTFSKSRL